MKIEEEVWVIMTKDNEMIAKGVPRSRYLVSVSNKKDKKRILTYTSEKMAINGFTNSGFYNSNDYKDVEDYKAVKAIMILEVQE